MNIYEAPDFSRVEKLAIENSPLDPIYPPDEKIPVITVSNFPALGQLVAMRFLEWVQDHPGGVISLPTGKTPEHFIKWVNRLVQTWDEPPVRELLEQHGVDPGRRPDMQSLHFVQIDEFYPIQPTQKNSFYYYVRKYYIEGMGLDPHKSLLMNCQEIGIAPGQDLETIWPDSTVDLSLRTRQAVTDLERMQQQVLSRIDDWCQKREEQIRQLGGLGFFLGGIGPDGHIGFNVRGSDHYSTTRLMATNYETQAAAAGDLGGIEVSRQETGDHHRFADDHVQSGLHCDYHCRGGSQGGRDCRRRAGPSECPDSCEFVADPAALRGSTLRSERPRSCDSAKSVCW